VTLEVALFESFYIGESGQREIDRVHAFDHHALVPRTQRELEHLAACCRNLSLPGIALFDAAIDWAEKRQRLIKLKQ
jgi:hypothetical protein